MGLFSYQEQVFNALREHKRVILQAPTGTGKTCASLYPFLCAWVHPDVIELPRQCIYSVPLRTLANQFVGQYESIVQDYRQKYDLRTLGRVALQTGERPNDPRFESDLLFTTIDQTLSSFLSIPYALSTGLANFNAGAVLGAYHVFDEYHLFPINREGSGAFATTLHMLHLLRNVTPWTLMTATFSRTLLHELCERLGAIEISPSTTSFDDIPSQKGKERRFTIREDLLRASHVWDDMQEHNRSRVLVICNTVDRAMNLASELRQMVPSDVRVVLFHSRFFPQDRATIERRLCREFGKDKQYYTSERVILVATQVVEVGLDITSQVLHTELAPASSIIQRAGRCARFAGEHGQVFIYDVPQDEHGKPQYAPYKEQSEVCELSWQEFLRCSGQSLDYTAELTIVDESHSEFDKRFLERFDAQRHEQDKMIRDAWTHCERNLGRTLIRDIDNVIVIIHPNPSQETLPDPYTFQGISIRRSTLMGKWKLLEELGTDLDWIIAIPQEVRREESEIQVMGQYQQPIYSWKLRLRQGSKIADIGGVDLIIINPAVVRYDSENGLSIEAGDAQFASPIAVKSAEEQKRDRHSYSYETYEQHIEKLFRVHRRDLQPQQAYAEQRLEQRMNLPRGTIDRALRLVFAIHDVGKLHEGWQHWARHWQQEVHKLNPHAILPPPDVVIAHTDFNGDDPAQRQLQKKVTGVIGKRPNHAAESVVACEALLREVAGESEYLYRAMITAVARHHSAQTEGDAGAFRGYDISTQYQAAKEGLQKALGSVYLHQMPISGVRWESSPMLLTGAFINPHDSEDAALLYFFLVRLLRRADQLALQES